MAGCGQTRKRTTNKAASSPWGLAISVRFSLAIVLHRAEYVVQLKSYGRTLRKLGAARLSAKTCTPLSFLAFTVRRAFSPCLDMADSERARTDPPGNYAGQFE